MPKVQVLFLWNKNLITESKIEPNQKQIYTYKIQVHILTANHSIRLHITAMNRLLASFKLDGIFICYVIFAVLTLTIGLIVLVFDASALINTRYISICLGLSLLIHSGCIFYSYDGALLSFSWEFFRFIKIYQNHKYHVWEIPRSEWDGLGKQPDGIGTQTHLRKRTKSPRKM